jgi:adenylosuccinate lyase
MPTSAIDSLVFRDMFGDREVRQIWSDDYRTRCYLDWEAALGRDEAHDLVYDLCRKSLEQDRPLADLLAERQTVMTQLSRDEIQALTDPANYLGLAGVMTDEVLAFASHAAYRSALRS